MTHQPADRASEELVQIGDLAHRTGASVDTLRAWERRYGLLAQRRSPGGFRMYSSRDVTPENSLALARADLHAALTAFQGERAHRLLDELLAGFTLDTASNNAGYFPSRSRMRNRTVDPASYRSMARLRAA